MTDEQLFAMGARNKLAWQIDHDPSTYVPNFMKKMEVVWATYPDPNNPGQMAKKVIKGQGKMMLYEQGAKMRDVPTWALEFGSEQEADEMRRLWGDGRAET